MRASGKAAIGSPERSAATTWSRSIGNLRLFIRGVGKDVLVDEALSRQRAGKTPALHRRHCWWQVLNGGIEQRGAGHGQKPLQRNIVDMRSFAAGRATPGRCRRRASRRDRTDSSQDNRRGHAATARSMLCLMRGSHLTSTMQVVAIRAGAPPRFRQGAHDVLAQRLLSGIEDAKRRHLTNMLLRSGVSLICKPCTMTFRACDASPPR